MRRITSELGGVPAAAVRRLRQLESGVARPVRFLWLARGETSAAKREALIASGEWDPNADYVWFKWSHDRPDPKAVESLGAPAGT